MDVSGVVKYYMVALINVILTVSVLYLLDQDKPGLVTGWSIVKILLRATSTPPNTNPKALKAASRA
jgi:hypothetical protein